MALAAPLPVQQGGAIAGLVARYLVRRGIPKTKLARRVGTHDNVIRSIVRGHYDNGTPALGLKRGPDGRPLLLAIADELDIPEPELDAAILADIKRDFRAASSTGRASDF